MKKVRDKKTNELINISDDSVMRIVDKNNLVTSLEIKLQDVEFLNDEEDVSRHWKNIREQAAISAMHGILTQNQKYMVCVEHTKYRDTARESIKYADALIEELKKN